MLFTSTLQYLYQIINSLMVKKIKTCVLGSVGVGKSTIILRIIEGSFQELPPTVCMDYKSQKRMINKEEVYVQFWDTSGQDRFRSVACNFFKKADGILLVYDITNEQSFNDLDYWINQLNEHLDQKVPRIIVANKCDLTEKISLEAEQKIKTICESNHFSFYKVSAKNGTNIITAYEALLEDSYKYVSGNKKKEEESSIIISIPAEKKKGGCC